MERSWRLTWTNRPATSLERARPSHVVHGVGMTSCVRFCGFGNLIARIREVLRAFPMLCHPLACGCGFELALRVFRPRVCVARKGLPMRPHTGGGETYAARGCACLVSSRNRVHASAVLSARG